MGLGGYPGNILVYYYCLDGGDDQSFFTVGVRPGPASVSLHNPRNAMLLTASAATLVEPAMTCKFGRLIGGSQMLILTSHLHEAPWLVCPNALE